MMNSFRTLKKRVPPHLKRPRTFQQIARFLTKPKPGKKSPVIVIDDDLWAEMVKAMRMDRFQAEWFNSCAGHVRFQLP
jgi:hypothetical protein